MKIEHLALAGVGLLLLTRSASAGTSSPSTDTGTGTPLQNAVAQLPIQIAYSAEQLPEGILQNGEQGIYASALPKRLRANALNDLKDAFQKLKDDAGLTSLWRAYKALETPIGAARASGSNPITLLTKYNEMEARYRAGIAPLAEWYKTEKERIYATYTV